MNHLTDKELVSLFSTDKERAFNLFFQRYYIRLCMYAVQITDDFSNPKISFKVFLFHFGKRSSIKPLLTI